MSWASYHSWHDDIVIIRPGSCQKKEDNVESLQSHFILTMSHWSSGLPVCFLSEGTQLQILRGQPMWNRDSPISVVSLHWWPRRDWSLWPPLRRASSRTVTRPSCWQCDNPTWFHTAFLSRFHARCRSSFQFHNQHSRLPGESLPVCFPSQGTWVRIPRGHLSETGILPLALSRYYNQ
jgi:hypothetical protein